ncbi:MAG: preprotein translocase subunit SecG [Candidatus Pacebacteria bacterium]|nr:preprotein translocase subunit SecG [Candidatus Paceibacterota bacterium]
MSFLAPFLPWIQIIVSALLVAAILLQQSEASLGSAFGAHQSGGFHEKRGLEKKLFIVTIILAIIFALSAVAALFI